MDIITHPIVVGIVEILIGCVLLIAFGYATGKAVYTHDRYHTMSIWGVGALFAFIAFMASQMDAMNQLWHLYGILGFLPLMGACAGASNAYLNTSERNFIFPL